MIRVLHSQLGALSTTPVGASVISTELSERLVGGHGPATEDSFPGFGGSVAEESRLHKGRGGSLDGGQFRGVL